MSFSSPLWLWGLVGLGVPLLIHMLSRGRRQRIVIGSIRHLQGSESRVWRRLRMSGWLQLLLRSALLAALVLALAGPRWLVEDAGPATGGWVLLDPELLDLREELSDGDFGRQIEAARKNASSIRLLAPGLPEEGGPSPPAGAASAWSLLREADEMAPIGVPITVFTLDRVGWLSGRRPVFARPVIWEVAKESASNRWIQRALASEDGSFEVTVGESSARGTWFERVDWSTGELPPDSAGLKIDPVKNTMALTMPGRLAEDARVTTPRMGQPIRVTLVAGADRADDEWYLRRALETVSQYMGRELLWVEDGGSPVDLEIYLGVESTGSPSGSVMLADSDRATTSCQGAVYAESMPRNPWLRLALCPEIASPSAGAPWWQDNWGRSFISRGTGDTYELQGRFNSAWSNLVVSPILPRLLLNLLEPDLDILGGASTANSDRRATTAGERLPRRVETQTGSATRSSTMPESLAWILVALLLIMERWITGRMG